MSYIEGIVKLLETPKQSFLNKSVKITKVRAQLPQLKRSQIVNLTFWGNLACDVNNYYKTNDYIIIEGYLSLRTENKLNSNYQGPKKIKIEITVLKVYPLLLNYDSLQPSTSN